MSPGLDYALLFLFICTYLGALVTSLDTVQIVTLFVLAAQGTEEATQ